MFMHTCVAHSLTNFSSEDLHALCHVFTYPLYSFFLSCPDPDVIIDHQIFFNIDNCFYDVFEIKGFSLNSRNSKNNKIYYLIFN